MSTIIEYIRIGIIHTYWLPEMTKTMWKFQSGRLFVFRDESDEFLNYLMYIYLNRDLTTEPSKDKGTDEYLAAASLEVKSRDFRSNKT